MPKVLCIFGMAIAGVVLVLFMLDLTMGIPFKKSGGWGMDLMFVLCAVGLGVLSWMTFREQD